MNKFFNFRQLWRLTVSLFLEIIREPGVLFWGILFPILMSLGLGLAFTKKTDVIRKVAVIQNSGQNDGLNRNAAFTSFINNKCERNTGESADNWSWRYSYNDSKLGNSIFLFYSMNSNEAMKLLKRGTINVILTGTKDSVEYHFDPMNADAELTYLKLMPAISKAGDTEIKGNAEIRPLTITGTRYIDFFVPGLITMGVMMSCMWGISYGIIEKRSKKLLRRLVATPMRKSHFLIALIAVRILMNIIESSVLLVFAMIAFGIKIQGDPSSLVIIYIAGNVAFSGIAVFVSSNTSNTEVGNGLINFVVFPMMVLSGIFFSYQNFPDWSIGVIKYLPLTILTDGVRSIFNEGAGYQEVAVPVLVLLTIGIVFFSAGLKIFKWH